MTGLRLSSPIGRLFYRSFPFEDIDEKWPDLTMTEGIDLYEEEDYIVVKASVPGIPAENVEVTFENGVLRIIAKQEESIDEKNKKRVVYRLDRVTSFDYTTTLPRPVDSSTIKADIKDGVVVIRAKIAETAKPRRIAVNTK